MDTDIKFFVKSIIEKINVNFSVYDANGQFLAGRGEKLETLPLTFNSIKAVEELNKTFFGFKYKGRNYVGSIDGVNDIAKNYAFLIRELAECVTPKDYSLSKTEFYEALLSGELNTAQVDHYLRKFSMKDTPAFVMILSIDTAHCEEVKNLIENIGSESGDFIVELGANQFAFVKLVDEQDEEYHSAYEYAEFLKQSIYEESGAIVRIAIGGKVKNAAELCTSYSQAVAAVRMRNTVNAKGEIHSYKEYVLVKMLEDLPKFTRGEYLETLMDSGAREIFDDEEMVNTAEEFLENSLNVSETSRKLYLHRNTLTYRLDKIERATGLNIRKFSDAVTFRLITVLFKLAR